MTMNMDATDYRRLRYAGQLLRNSIVMTEIVMEDLFISRSLTVLFVVCVLVLLFVFVLFVYLFCVVCC